MHIKSMIGTGVRREDLKESMKNNVDIHTSLHNMMSRDILDSAPPRGETRETLVCVSVQDERSFCITINIRFKESSPCLYIIKINKINQSIRGATGSDEPWAG
jgi:hypothetical protein